MEYDIKKKKHLKINNIKTTYNKRFKTKLKVIKVASITSIKKANTSFISLRQNKWHVILLKAKAKR